MIAGWQEVTVGELAARQRNALVGGPFGSNLVSSDYVPNGVPVIRGQNMGNGRWVSGEFAYVSPEKAQSLSANLARPGDLVFTQRGTLGQVAIVPEGQYDEYLISQSQMKLTPDRNKANPLFLYYAFRSPAQQRHIVNSAIQTGVPHTNLTILRETPLRLPPLREQKSIAETLGSLDDKIELNRRMNETLEATARAIFKSRFVDRDPRSSASQAGWQAGTFGKVAENPRDQVSPGDVPVDTPYIGLEHMPRKSIALSDWGKAGDVASNKFAFRAGDILFGKLRPYFHKVGVAAIDGVCSTDILVIRPKDPDWFGFVLGHASSGEIVEFASAGSTGTKMPRTSWNELSRFEISVPSAEIARAFNAIALTLIRKVQANIHESRTLAEIRDALLPRLISGEIRISEAERIAEAHA